MSRTISKGLGQLLEINLVRASSLMCAKGLPSASASVQVARTPGEGPKRT